MKGPGFFILLGGLLAAATSTGHAQAPTGDCLAPPTGTNTRVIGFLKGAPNDVLEPRLMSFLDGLKSVDYVENRDFIIEYRLVYGLNGAERDEITRRLISCNPALIVAAGSTAAAESAMRLTANTTIPVVFVASFSTLAVSRNATGAFIQEPTGAQSQIEQLRAQIQRLGQLKSMNKVGVLINANMPQDRQGQMRSVVGPNGRLFPVTPGPQFEGQLTASFAEAMKEQIDGMIVSADQYFATQRKKITAEAANHNVPTLYPLQEYIDAGGLISYGVDLAKTYFEIGQYTGRILSGVASPRDLSVLRKMPEIGTNEEAATKLGLTIPPVLIRESSKHVRQK
jgi:putative ABC transport system substrate-binding protein